MQPNAITKTIDIGDGHPITIETGKLAKQADGAVVVRQGDTMLLATVVSNHEAREGIDFLPLAVEYREKYASAGKFPGGFFKREARPSEAEILTCRLVDRALRPLFPGDYHAETQVHIMMISTDKENLPDSLACLGASAALAISDIPFAGPVSEVRVARVDGKFVINPRRSELDQADMDMIIAGTADNIVMVEGEMSEVSEAEMVEAIKAAHEAIKYHCKVQNDLADAVGRKETRTYSHETPDDEALMKAVHEACYQKCYDIAKKGAAKEERKAAFSAIKEEYMNTFSPEELEEKGELISKYFNKTNKAAMRRLVLDEGVRLDGRRTDQIRPIWGEVDYLPGTHGSAIFTRGETQALMTLTIGSKMDEQTVDSPLMEGSQDFMLHYNFPPFSTGEARMIRGTSRREVGHGNLALRALKPVIPGDDENPYTIRLVSEILESNGSSSMATVCSGTMALMDGGVKIKSPVSGIAMGLITDDQGKYAVLSDILGDEDHLGDMDFKVTGTTKGITACQMDIKVDGLSYEVLTQALEQAKVGRIHILEEMQKVIDAPREDYKPHAPRIISFDIPKETIGMVIGPGGSVIRELQEETGATIIIDEVDGVGKVQVLSADKPTIDAAVGKIKTIAFPPTAEVGEEYEGKVKTIMPYGAFVEVVPGTDGLLHISELEWRKVDKVEDILKEGEMVKFKVIGKDPRSGKLKLSRKVLLPRPERNEA